MRRAERSGQLKFIHGDLGPTRGRGFPKFFYGRSRALLNAIAMRYVGLRRLGEPSIDVGLVDGRFRLACGLEAAPYLLRGNGVLLMHDFVIAPHGFPRSRFEQYNTLVTSGIYRKVGVNFTLGIFRPVRRAVENRTMVSGRLLDALQSPL